MANDEKRVTYYDPPANSIPDKIKQLIGNMIQTFWGGRADQIRAWLVVIGHDVSTAIDGYFDRVSVVQGSQSPAAASVEQAKEQPSLQTYPMPVTSTGITGWIQRLVITILGFTGYVGPYARLTEYVTEHSAHTARLEPALLATAIRRGVMSPAEAVQWLRDIGYTDDMMETFMTLTRAKPDVGAVADLTNRQIMTENEAIADLVEDGYTDTDAGRLIQLFKLLPGPSDLGRMANKWAFDDGLMTRLGYDADSDPKYFETMAKQGFDQYWSNKFWRAHWETISIGQAIEALHRRAITPDQFDDIFKLQDIPRYYLPIMKAITYDPYTRVDVRRMYNAHVLTVQDVFNTYLDLGYDTEHAQKLTDFTTADRQAANKELSKSEVMTGYRRGLLTEGECRTQLAALGYDAEEVNYYIRYVQYQIQTDRTQPDKALQKADLVSAYKNGVTTRQELLDGLSTLGYDERERTLIANVADAQMTETKHVPNKELAKSEIVAAYTDHLIDSGMLTTLLGQLGYDASETEFIVNLADFKIAQAYAKDTVDLIHAQYVNGTIDETALITSLNKLNLSDITLQFYRYKWGLERESKVVTPTFSQFSQMYKKNIINTTEFLHALETLGYQDPYKTWLYRLVTGLRPGEPAP